MNEITTVDKIKEIIRSDKELAFGIAIIISYLLLQIPPYFVNAWVPDESEFYYIANKVAPNLNLKSLMSFIFTQKNELGYGSFYWIFYSILIRATSTVGGLVAFKIMRLISLSCMLLIPIVIFRRGRALKSSYYAILAIILWITFPVAWWYGKVTGPETLSLGFCVLGLHFSTLSKFETLKDKVLYLMGWLLLGLSIGIKLTSLPVVVFAGIINLFYYKKDMKAILLIPLALVVGFLIANPFTVHNFNLFWETLRAYKSPPKYTFQHLRYIFFSESYTWDIVLNGSFFQWGFSVLGFVGFVAILIYTKVPKKFLFSLFSTILFATVLFLSNARFLGWYWFPVLTLFPFVLLESRRQLTKFSKYFLFILVILLSIPNIPTIIFGYKLKLQHAKNVSKRNEVQNFITETLNKLNIKFDDVIDFSEIKERYNTPAQFYEDKFNVSKSFFQWFSNRKCEEDEDEKGKQEYKVLLLLGDRLSLVEPYSSFREQLEAGELRNKSYTFSVLYNEKCSFLSLYVLIKKKI